MKKIAFASIALVLFASAVCLVSADTWKGSISDKMCGADHHGMDASKCTAACVKKGSAYVFVVGKDKIYDIENQKDAKVAADLEKHAGHNVEVSGTMSKDAKSVKIDSIKMPAAKK